MHALITVATLILLATLSADHAAAAVYSYKDENGRTVFVDDEHRIPAQYRGSSTTLQESIARPEPAKEEGDESTPAPAAAPAQTTNDRESQLRARQQVERLDRERAHQTPVMVRGPRVLVPVEVVVGNRTAHLMLLLDTGATITVLHRPSVKNLPFQPGEQITARIAGGRTVSSEKVITGHLDIGPFVMKDFPVVLITPQGSTLPFDGMLGMDFLKDHPHTIDYDNEIIHWKTQP
jgi:hypothetical protein